MISNQRKINSSLSFALSRRFSIRWCVLSHHYCCVLECVRVYGCVLRYAQLRHHTKFCDTKSICTDFMGFYRTIWVMWDALPLLVGRVSFGFVVYAWVELEQQFSWIRWQKHIFFSGKEKKSGRRQEKRQSNNCLLLSFFTFHNRLTFLISFFSSLMLYFIIFIFWLTMCVCIVTKGIIRFYFDLFLWSLSFIFYSFTVWCWHKTLARIPSSRALQRWAQNKIEN